jgi:Ca2+-binding RTX toxin-like protein
VLAGLGDDTAFGGRGSDIIAGGSGRDLIAGGNGADVLADGAGNDLSRGGNGRDLLVDGAGFDILSGGCGDDAFVFAAATLMGGSLAGNGGVLLGGSGYDTAYLVLDEATRSAVTPDLHPKGGHYSIAAIGIELWGIEEVTLLDADDPVDGIATSAPIDQASRWGLI